MKAASNNEILTAERCWITELSNAPEDPGCSIARARVAPGVTTQRHALRGIVERYVILAGRGRVEVGASTAIEVDALQVVTIPAGIAQRITNIGSGDLVFLCVCTPRFTADAYHNLEGLPT